MIAPVFAAAIIAARGSSELHGLEQHIVARFVLVFHDRSVALCCPTYVAADMEAVFRDYLPHSIKIMHASPVAAAALTGLCASSSVCISSG